MDGDGVAIPYRDPHVDLGIIVSKDMSFELHINNFVSKAQQRVSTLFRGFHSRNVSTMRLGFTTYIHSISENNSIMWNPNCIHLIDLIENPQRNFPKRIPSLLSLPVPNG
jgi:hypothetical protein